MVSDHSVNQTLGSIEINVGMMRFDVFALDNIDMAINYTACKNIYVIYTYLRPNVIQ